MQGQNYIKTPENQATIDRLAALNYKRYSRAIRHFVAIDDAIYAMTDENMYCYDMQADTWTKKSWFNEPKRECMAVSPQDLSEVFKLPALGSLLVARINTSGSKAGSPIQDVIFGF